MLTKSQCSNQNELFRSRLDSIIDLNKPLCVLSTKINWSALEELFSKYYSKDFGRPSKSIRLMVSLLILKHLYNMSDESVVERWSENPYWQYFSGMEYFQWHLPCDPTELVKFRNRIGDAGVEEIFKQSIEIHGKSAMEKEVIQDTTVQEKNITFPTDSKLHIKIIKLCLKLAKSYNIKLRQSYKTTLKHLRWSLRYLNSPKRRKEALKAMRKIKTIAGRLVREILRKLSNEQLEKHKDLLDRMQRVLNQKRTDKNKIYSLHEPDVACIAKGKEHKKYEFGSKVSITITKTNCIIVGAKNFLGNPYDGNTLEPSLEQVTRLRESPPAKVLVDEGYRGRAKIGETEIVRAHRKKEEKGNKDESHSKYKRKKWFNRRAAVEPVIGHLKKNYRMATNYLKGSIGDSVNLMLAATAFNINKWLKNLVFWLFSIFDFYRFFTPKVYCK